MTDIGAAATPPLDDGGSADDPEPRLLGMTLAQYAGVTTGLGEAHPLDVVLANEGVDPAIYGRATSAWSDLLADELDGEATPLNDGFARRLGDAQDRLGRSIAPLADDLAAWLTFVRVWSADPDPTRFLADRGLRGSDVIRLQRGWARRLEIDPKLQREVQTRFGSEPGEIPALTIGPSRLVPPPPVKTFVDLEPPADFEDDEEDEEDEDDEAAAEPGEGEALPPLFAPLAALDDEDEEPAPPPVPAAPAPAPLPSPASPPPRAVTAPPVMPPPVVSAPLVAAPVVQPPVMEPPFVPLPPASVSEAPATAPPATAPPSTAPVPQPVPPTFDGSARAATRTGAAGMKTTAMSLGPIGPAVPFAGAPLSRRPSRADTSPSVALPFRNATPPAGVAASSSALPPRNATPPSGIAAPAAGAPPAAAPTLTLLQYASLCAELEVSPTTSEQIFIRYGLADPTHRRAVDLAWKERLQRDAAARQEWQRAYQTYRASLLAR